MADDPPATTPSANTAVTVKEAAIRGTMGQRIDPNARKSVREILVHFLSSE
jgi:hypothetical protein